MEGYPSNQDQPRSTRKWSNGTKERRRQLTAARCASADTWRPLLCARAIASARADGACSRRHTQTNDAPPNGACDIAVGSMVEVYWSMENEWWPAKVTRFDKELNRCFVYYYTVASRGDDGWIRLNGKGAQYIRLDRGNVKRE